MNSVDAGAREALCWELAGQFLAEPGVTTRQHLSLLRDVGLASVRMEALPPAQAERLSRLNAMLDKLGAADLPRSA